MHVGKRIKRVELSAKILSHEWKFMKRLSAFYSIKPIMSSYEQWGRRLQVSSQVKIRHNSSYMHMNECSKYFIYIHTYAYTCIIINDIYTSRALSAALLYILSFIVRVGIHISLHCTPSFKKLLLYTFIYTWIPLKNVFCVLSAHTLCLLLQAKNFCCKKYLNRIFYHA